MTKQELELENKFLKLQLKIIGDVLNGINYSDYVESGKMGEKVGLMRFYADLEKCSERFQYINQCDLPYNFFDKNIEI